MKPRIRLVLVVVAGVVALSACSSGSSKKGAGGPTTTATLRPGECNVPGDAYTKTIGNAADFKPLTAGALTVATSLPAPGFWNGDDIDPASVKSGFEYQLARALQSQFGLKKLVVHNVSVDDILKGSIGSADIALSQIAASCRLVSTSNLSTPYLLSNQGVLVTKKFAGSVANADDISALRWGTESETAAVDALLRFSVRPRTYTTLEDAYSALRAGKIDAVLTDTSVALGKASQSKGSLRVIAQIGQISGPDQYTVVLPKSSANAPAVNAALQELQKSGELARLAKANLTVDPATLPLIALPQR
jgi:polar amino acid transport system substrate-binding protein